MEVQVGKLNRIGNTTATYTPSSATLEQRIIVY
jgi:hypothetical protein